MKTQTKRKCCEKCRDVIAEKAGVRWCNNPNCPCHKKSECINRCSCSCHENKLGRPYSHDTRCCDKMNGFLESAPQDNASEEWAKRLRKEFQYEYSDSPNEDIINSPEKISGWWLKEIQSLLSNQLKKVDGMKIKCDGENGCGYDGSQDDRQYICGGPIAMNGPNLHEVIKIHNKTVDDIINKLK